MARPKHHYPTSIHGLTQGATDLCLTIEKSLATARGAALLLDRYATRLREHPDLGNGPDVASRFSGFAGFILAIRLPDWRIGGWRLPKC